MTVAVYVLLDLSLVAESGNLQFLFTYPSETVDLGAIPALESVRVTPAVLDPGRSIGQRETVSVKLSDFQYRFGTEDFEASSFWPKFRARYGGRMPGLPLKVYRGEAGDALEDMELREYVIGSMQIDESGATIAAKDPLVLLLPESAQAPAVNTGELLSGIDEDDMSFTLNPAGIGNAEYPSSGKGCLGGSEIVSFTRSGDDVTLTSRGENLGGVGEAHDAETKFQVCLEYDGESPSSIINDLLTNYTQIDPSWITVADWQNDVDDYIDRLYGAIVPEPTAVTKLIDELCEQVGLVFYWDSAAQQLRLKPIVPSSPSFSLDADSIVSDSFSVREQPDRRVSQIWTYYAQKDPVRKLDETSNYRRVAVKVADNEGDFRQPAIKKIFSRWIASRSTAERLNDMIIARYKVPPRSFSFDLFRNGEAVPALGSAVDVSHWQTVDEDGVQVAVASQIISAAIADAEVSYQAEEANFDGSFDTTKLVYIDADDLNVNLRDRYDDIYSGVDSSDDVVFRITSGTRIGTPWRIGSSTIAGLPTNAFAVYVGDWPEGPNSLTLIVDGEIRAGGGAGGSVYPGSTGAQGGGGLYTRVAMTVVNNGTIAGGGGGGGAAPSYGGGGGAGFSLDGLGVQNFAPGGVADLPSYPASPPNGAPGTMTSGGAAGGAGAGAGGGPGQAGGNGTHGSGGAAGPGVDGESYVTYSVEGTILGPRIN